MGNEQSIPSSSPFDIVLDDLVECIFSFVPQHDHKNIAIVCKKWHAILCQPSFLIHKTIFFNHIRATLSKSVIEHDMQQEAILRTVFKSIHPNHVVVCGRELPQEVLEVASQCVMSCTFTRGVSLGHMQSVASLTRLTSLVLRQSNHVQEGFSYLTRLTGLLSLNIHNITDDVAETMQRFTRLTSLKLVACPKLTEFGFGFLTSLSRLEKLELLECSFSAQISKFTKLKSFFFESHGYPRGHYSQVTRSSDVRPQVRLMSLPITSRMKSLGLCGINELTNEILMTFLLDCPYLTSLDVSGAVSVSKDGLSYIRALSSLKSLKASYSSISFQHFEELDDCCQANLSSGLKNLRALDLLGCHVGNGTGANFLKGMTSLTSLIVGHAYGDPGELSDDFLNHVRKMTNLRVLEADHWQNLTNAGIKNLKYCQKLQRLNLAQCTSIGDDGIQHFSVLTCLTFLRLSVRVQENASLYEKLYEKLASHYTGPKSFVSSESVHKLQNTLPQCNIQGW